jgi:alpha-glucosidase
VPLPWEGDRPPFGFTRDGVPAWLPQPPAWAALTAAVQVADPGSTWALYRAALRLRRRLRDTPFAWQPSADGVLAFDRGPSFRCVVNLSGEPVGLAGQCRVLLSSAPCTGGLPPDTAVWLAPDEERDRPPPRLSSSP